MARNHPENPMARGRQVKSRAPDRAAIALIDSLPEGRKRRARTGTNAMRGLLTAYLAFFSHGGLFAASGSDAARARFTKTMAKTTTAKTV
jgi:hypothetical protein